MSRASPLPRSGDLSKAVMVGVTGSLGVESDLPVAVTERPLVSLLQLFGNTKPNVRFCAGFRTAGPLAEFARGAKAGGPASRKLSRERTRERQAPGSAGAMGIT